MTEPPCLEFYGLPGVGKSTISSAVVARLEADGLRVCTRARVTRWLQLLSLRQKAAFRLRALRHMLSHPRLLCAYTFGTRPIWAVHVRRLYTLFMKLEALRTLEKNGHYDVFVFDQWFLQDIWSLLINAERFCENLPAHLLKAIDIETSVCYPQAPVSEVAGRLSARSHGLSRFDGLSEHRSEAVLMRCQALTAALAAQAHVRSHLFEIDARQDVATAAQEVIDRMFAKDGSRQRIIV